MLTYWTSCMDERIRNKILSIKHSTLVGLKKIRLGSSASHLQLLLPFRYIRICQQQLVK